MFLDEIHRRTKTQQDALLPHVEQGTIILIGATTENPSFTVINALLSRCRVYVFEPISGDDIAHFLESNIENIKEYYPNISLPQDLCKILGSLCDGDLRMGINLLETALVQKQS